MPTVGAITELLDRLGDPEGSDKREVLDRLIPLLYSELKTLAKSSRYRWQGRQGLGTTSLMHEAYARLAAHPGGQFENQRQFFALASRVMRSILIDNARQRSRQKRGGGHEAVTLPEQLFVSASRSGELIALDDALKDLESHDAELARIVECRCFGGLTVEETAEALGVSSATIKRRWALARAWLYRYLVDDTSSGRSRLEVD